jgi:pimeloyl-ACP methyl ester carboxylesterase
VGRIVPGIRFVAVCVVGLALSGCATFIPFQSSNEVIVRVGDKPDIYPVQAVAGAYASSAVLATLAYQDTTDTSVFGEMEKQAKLRLAGWRRVPLPKYVCPAGRICTGEVGEQLWIRRDDKSCREAVVVFRGTVSTHFDDWVANFHWFNRLTPVDDYYDQARDNIGKVVAIAERQGCGGRIIAVGHSLGGGLAQHVAYANPKIRTVYAFDPSFVIGSTDFNMLGLPIYREGRKFDYVYEHGEILAFLRFIGRQFHPYAACNPRIRTVRFNTLTGSIVNQHRIVDFTKKLIQNSQAPVTPDAKPSVPPPPRVDKKFKLDAGCPVAS